MKVIRSRNKQSDTNFYLRDKNSDKPTPIIFLYKYNKEQKNRFKYSTGLAIKPIYWDDNKQRVKASVVIDYKTINQTLDLISKSAKSITDLSLYIPYPELRNRIDDVIGKKYVISDDVIGNRCPSFLEWVESFISKEKERLDVSDLTIKKYKSEFAKIKKFIETKYLNLNLSFDDIDFRFVTDYKTYLYSHPLNSSQNTVSKTFEVLAKFLKSATKDTYLNAKGEKTPVSNNLIYLDDNWAVNRVKTTKSILTFDQLIHLYNFDFSSNETFSKVRYLFLVMGFTGLRISDMLSLSKNSIITEPDGTVVLKVFVKKGKERKNDSEIIIPLIKELLEIFEMYNYSIPNDITEQSLNKYIKQVCKTAGFDQTVQMNISAGGKTKMVEMPLYETITNHSARYSFITFAINEFGIRAEELQKITGQSLKVLLAYEKGNKMNNAKRVALNISSQRGL